MGMSNAQQQTAIQHLSDGTLGAIQPITGHLTRQLLELQQSQQSLLEALHAENLQFSSDLEGLEYVQEHMAKVSNYLRKLKMIKANMGALSTSAERLKQRSAILHSKQTEQDAKRAQEEAQLIARPSAALQQRLEGKTR